MSSIWTPGGERPVEHDLPPEVPPEAEVEELQRELAATPAGEVVANHCFGLFELAALHLSLRPPQLAEASVAIDALAALTDGLPGRLGQHEAQLKEGLASLRLAFVQIKAANLGEGPSA
ncbi:MAG: hypothetical protein QOF60_2959 [Actinomycetota bacterium]|jgi:hypothetical protein|nr:hypothetical protein [Actinomycetota bacterium]